MENISDLYKTIGGEFLTAPEELAGKLKNVKAFLFDWDGVFNAGEKNGGSSSFNEIDSMITNMLRFSYFIQNKSLPKTAIMSGEKNETSFFFAAREHFDGCYFKIKHKTDALTHFCAIYNLKPEEVCFVFDDILDLTIAKVAGVRVCISRKAGLLFNEYIKKNKLADYMTGTYSGEFALREACEMLLGISGMFDECIDRRVTYDDIYQQYLMARENTPTHFYTFNRQIVNADIKVQL